MARNSMFGSAARRNAKCKIEGKDPYNFSFYIFNFTLFFILFPDPAPRPIQPLDPLAGGAPLPHFRQPGGLPRRRLRDLLLDVLQVSGVVLADRAHVYTASAAGVRAHPAQQRLPEIESITAAQQCNLLV